MNFFCWIVHSLSLFFNLYITLSSFYDSKKNTDSSFQWFTIFGTLSFRPLCRSRLWLSQRITKTDVSADSRQHLQLSPSVSLLEIVCEASLLPQFQTCVSNRINGSSFNRQSLRCSGSISRRLFNYPLYSTTDSHDCFTFYYVFER